MSQHDVPHATARRLHRVLDLYHAVTYLAPQAQEAFRAAGLSRPWGAYFAGRSAPLGAVSAPLVTAVFYHFKPAMVAAELPGAWEQAGPEKVLAARLEGADAALRALLGDAVEGDEIAEAADLAVGSAAACAAPGRPLGAVNAALPSPSRPHLRLWQAATTLREFRGDGHVIALAQAGFDGVEALITITAAGGERRQSIQARRGWADEEWAAGELRLRERGLLDADGSLTETGAAARRQVEELTDRLALPPWQAIGITGAERLLTLVQPLAERIVAELGLPAALLVG
jgi:hypothetical protein